MPAHSSHLFHLTLCFLLQAVRVCTCLCLAGMIFVPPGYSLGADMFNLDEVKGGSPWGASTFAGGDNSRKVSETELKYAQHQVGEAMRDGQYVLSVECWGDGQRAT